jgi:hypothetical protein
MVPAGEPWLEVEGTLVSRNFRRSVLYVYNGSISVQVNDTLLSATLISVSLKAMIGTSPMELHVTEEALGDREYGGGAIASLCGGSGFLDSVIS